MIKKISALTLMAIFALPLSFSAEITIPMANGENKTIGSTFITEFSEGEYTDRGSQFSLEDANNDGYMDVLECDLENSGAYNIWYNLYIYNPKTGCFNEPQGFYNIGIKKDGTISEYFKGRGLGDFGGTATWKWDGKKYIKLSDEGFFILDDGTYYTQYTEFSNNGKESEVLSVKYYKETSSGKKIPITKKEYDKAQNDKFGD